MKKLLLLLVGTVCAGSAMAQMPFFVNDSLTVNNINCGMSVMGSLFDDVRPGGYFEPHCSFPAGSGKHLNLSASIWMSGYDAGGQLHVAAQTYRQDGNDYWPGPLDGGDTLTYATANKWAKIWKVSRADILHFQSLATHDVTNTPPDILSWPGKGNTHAAGNGGYALDVNKDMAPFTDLNGNGIYEPLLGEFPIIKGDQALWSVFSDNGPTHNQSHGRPLGVEVHLMAYGYRRFTSIDNALFFEYDIINNSSNTYDSFRVAAWDDADLGYYLDDYIGFDSAHRMGITYNANNDDGATGLHPSNSYGLFPPIEGLSMIVAPGDAGSYLAPAGSFLFYNLDMSVAGNPVSPGICNHYMHARNLAGVHFPSLVAATGPCAPDSATAASCNYVFTGDPAVSGQWTECCISNALGDRLFVLSSGDITLPAGGSTKMVLALMARDHAGGCPETGFTDIKSFADTVWGVYQNPPAPLPVSVGNTNLTQVIVHPNPARDELLLSGAGGGDGIISIYNTVGQALQAPIHKKSNDYAIDISRLAPGVYHLRYSHENEQRAATFVKE